MVLADSHTISKSIDNNEKVDDIFESINDVDRPTIPKTRKDRQHKYKLYYTKDDDVQGIKITKPYSEVEKATDKITFKPTPKLTIENAKRHKSPKRRVSSLWKKLRGKDKKKETEKHGSKNIRSNHKKEIHRIAYLTTKPDPGKTATKKKHRKKLHLRQSEHKLSKRDASGLFSTRPYSSTPQSYKLQMGIAPQVDNMLKSNNSKIKSTQPHIVAVPTADTPEVSDNLKAQLERINFILSKLKERDRDVLSTPNNNPSATSPEGNIKTSEFKQGIAQIDDMLAMKVKAVSMFFPSTVTKFSNDAAAATIDSNRRIPVSTFSTLVSDNKIAKEEIRTVGKTGTYALNLKDFTINANTESHHLVARSIKDDAMTIAMNVEDMIQRELKSLYNKVKHRVSNDFRKEVHTVKCTLKESVDKLSSKFTGKCKSNTTKCNCPKSSTRPPKHKTSPCKPILKKKVTVTVGQYTIPDRTSTSTTTTTTTTTTAPRVKKKDEKEEDYVEDMFFTPEAYGKQTYDDYLMLTLYEQMLAKKRENDVRKLLATLEFSTYAKNKRESRRLSKRNSETLTDVKLAEVVRNIYDEGGNMPDYDYIDPAANVSSTGRTTANSNSYNEDNSVVDDTLGSADYSSQGSKPLGNKPMPKRISTVHKEDGKAADANNPARGLSVNSVTVAFTDFSGTPASGPSFEGLSNKISYNQFVDGYKHYLKFQQELRNQNFSNLVKYQAHRHHSVDDIGKYILSKLPSLPAFNRRKRNLRFSDDSDNNMDYQEITSKSDDSWFKRHFYLFIDKGPPKKYHTSETVELKPGSVGFKQYFTNTTPATRDDFNRNDSQSIPRKTKNIQEISLDDLSKIMDLIKVQGSNNPLATENNTNNIVLITETQKENIFMNMDTDNATDDTTVQKRGFIGKFLSGKRRNASKKHSVTTVYFPTTNYMYADNQQGRFKRSTTKESFENTEMADFMNKYITEEKAATNSTKEVFADAAQTSNRETNKYGYVDIDLVPRQTAVAKLRDSTKKSIIKKFFDKFHFKKNKTKKSKPKRSAYYDFYSPSPRRERFNPIKKLKNIFKNKEVKEKKKDSVAPSPFHPDYEVNTYDANEDISTLQFDKPMKVAEIQNQIPNITDTLTEMFLNEHTTKENVAHHYELDDRCQDLLTNPLGSSCTMPLLKSRTKSAKRIMITKPVDIKIKQELATLKPSLTATKTSKLLKVPPCNVMTVNIKTMEPTKPNTRLKASEITSTYQWKTIAIEDINDSLEQIHKTLRIPSKSYPTRTTMYESYPTITRKYDRDSSFNLQTDKYDYKKNVATPLSVSPVELSIRSKLTRYVKFPIKQRRNKMKRGDDSEKRSRLGFDGSSVLKYIYDIRSSSTVPSEKRKTAVTTSKNVHPHTYKPNETSRYTDYFNDLLMWHSDILNLDSVPNPLWLNILKTLQTDAANSYTTPDMKNLMIDWNEINDYLGNNLNNSAETVPTNSTGVKAKDHVSVRGFENQLDNDEGVIRSVVMDDNTVVTSKDVLIRGEAKYFQYNKPHSQNSPDARASGIFVRKLNTLNKIGDDKKQKKVKIKWKGLRRESLTPADIPAVEPLLVDTTLMAYDDDVDSVGKELEVKKLCKAKSSQRSDKEPPPLAKTKHNSVLKTNKAPIQYYTTPLPMKSQDFHKFLKDYEMDVESVTAPIPQLLPFIHRSSPNKKIYKGSKQNGETVASDADPPIIIFNHLTTETVTTKSTTTARSKSSQLYMAILPFKFKNIAKTVGKIAKTSTTEQVKKKSKVVNNRILISKNSDWSEDINRYKRFNALKVTKKSASAATVKNKATHEKKYYDRFKKKMIGKLFEKKETEGTVFNEVTDHLNTETVTVNPRNNEVDITIINFDDLDKMSTSQHFNTFTLLKEDILVPSTDSSFDLDDAYNKLKSKIKINKEKEDSNMQKTTTETTEKVDYNIHNQLLYKDIYNERSTSTDPTTEYSYTYLTKKIEYDDPLLVKDGQNVRSNNTLRYPFGMATFCPKIFNKMQRGKNFHNPKRLHLSSHHFMYDIFFDDVKKTGKNGGVEVKPKLGPATSTEMRLFSKRTPTSEKGSNTAAVRWQIFGRTYRSRNRRRGPTAYVTQPILTSTPGNFSRVSEPKLEKKVTASVKPTKTISLARMTEPLADIEDLVTMMDLEDLGDYNSGIDSEVTLAAIRTEFITAINDKASERRGLVHAKPATAHVSMTIPVTTASTATTTTTSATVPSTTLPGSLNTTPSNKSSNDKENNLRSQRDRHIRLFKFSKLQQRLKSFMKNLTMTAKPANVTTPENAKSISIPMCKTKRLGINNGPEETKTAATKAINENQTTGTETAETTKEIFPEWEGFLITQHYGPEMLETLLRSTPTVETTVTPKRLLIYPDALYYEEEPIYNLKATQKHPATTPPGDYQHHSTHHVQSCVHMKPFPNVPNEKLYVEPQNYIDEFDEEKVTRDPPSTPSPREEKEPAPHCDFKREIQPKTFTAKDVAALEVIVDLMKNTPSYEENSVLSNFHQLIIPNLTTCRATNSNCSSTNAIQVHIAIPFGFENGKKRSPYSAQDPVRVRKVFSAKMSTPVDLEYQVHSLEGTIKPEKPETSTRSTDIDNLTPGMYLLIDKPKDGFALKPIIKLPSETTASMKGAKPTGSRDETTSLKSLAKVTLSKDFVALINRHLSQLHGNRSTVSKDVDSHNARLARSVWFRKPIENKKRRKTRAQKYIVKRRIDWDAVKAYFGHDRVCTCKCKSNTAMCRACAASDAVIDELIFEFDNIGRYMKDHCTEIQTFFWMNPIGGQKLKDSVSKIDKSLTDYCKRVKGKCQGRLCKTFSTYIDKRNFIKMAKIKKVEDKSCLLNDLATLVHDLNMTVALNVCYNDKLKENGEKFINLINNVINNKSLSKRSNPTTTLRRMVTPVYSLDNINVNIICNPVTPSTADEVMMATTIAPQTRSQQMDESMNDHLLHFNLEDNKHKKRNGFIHLFPRKNKKSKPWSFGINKKVKRQVDNQASMPLISDGGGAFWYDYLKAGANEPRLARKGRLHQKLEKLGFIKDTSTITVDVVQGAVTEGNVLTETVTAENNNLGINTIYKTDHTRSERNPEQTETTTDNLSQNINRMLQLFGNLQEIESMHNNTNDNPTTNLPRDTSIHTQVSQDKQKKISLVHKVKQKVDKALAKNRTKFINTKTKKKDRKMKTTLEQQTDELSTIENTIETFTQQAETTSDNFAVVSSTTHCKVTANTQTMNYNSTTVKLAAMSTASNKTASITAVATKGIAPKGNKKSESTPVVNETTTKFGSKNKIIKTATEMFIKGQTQTKQTPKKTTKLSTTTELNTGLTLIQTHFIDLVTSNLDNDYNIDESTQNITENPTILIINEYDSPAINGCLSDEMKEKYKNLLLSIIQFETNNLNDEWDRIANGGGRPRDHRDETDMKRSAPSTPKLKTKASMTLKLSSTTEAASSEEDTHLSNEPDKTTKTPQSLLNKIARKIGIEIVKSKQTKVVNKSRVREPRRNGKRANFIRNRKLRISSYKETPEPILDKEACHTRRTTHPAQICDIQATFKHIQDLQTSKRPKIFENLMKNVSCYKYRNADASFIIPYKKIGKTWDWIRGKRSLKHSHNKIKDEHDFDDDTFVVDFEDDSSDIFERFVRGDNGIYKIVQRKKRKVNLEALKRGLRNLPTLMPTDNELYVMVGDSVTLDCGINTPVRSCDGVHWKTDRKRMLEQDNVEVDGLTVAIHKVEPKNSGTYTCSLDHTVRKNVMLNVMTVPSFDVVFLPVYKTEDDCSYDNLIAIQQLGRLMANANHCGKACSVRIDEPVCQRDRSNNNTMLRATAVISMTTQPVNCSMQCKRDIVSSLVMLSAANAAVLSSMSVEVLSEGVCETLTPWRDCDRPVVTHTLRKKDANGHQEYHQLSSLMSPGKVNVVVKCPAGYYLMNKYKLCSSCPSNTSSKAGYNTCRSCPKGTSAGPGAATCHVAKILHHRRYDWWWYPPCGYVVACCGVLFGCTACVLLSVIVHVVSRDAELPKNDGDDEEQNIHKPMRSETAAYAHFPGARPLSPSRVILPRFFRPSLTSSRATDSQETKFELWKERNRPPPLPPIDFDH